jgi:hypothetical protein
VLLLVLIFVLAALGLLAVALATGAAFWAWISVVVSVVAAGILVADWAKRRAAVRMSGVVMRAAPGVPPSVEDSPTTAIPVSSPVVEPATEVFPALRQSYSSAPSATGDDRASVNSMPSGSSGLPPGAESEIGGSGDRQSPSVISAAESSSKEDVVSSLVQAGGPSEDRSDADFGGKGFDKADLGKAAGAATVAAALAAGATKDNQSGATPDARQGGTSPDQPAQRSGDSAAKNEWQSNVGSKPADDYSPWQPKAAEASSQRDSAKLDSAKPDKQDLGTQNSGKSSERNFVPSQQTGQRPTGQQPRQSLASPEGATAAGPQGSPTGQGRTPAWEAADRTTAISTAAVAGAGAAGLAAASIGRQDQDATPPPSEADPKTTAIPVMGGAQRSGQSDRPINRAEATQAIIPVKGPPPEPGEEKPDAAELATVSALDDEVLVIDEHPRFHLAGCQVLAGGESIPLPAKEAIEFGFSPCSVCSPVRVLASRNRAASSS